MTPAAAPLPRLPRALKLRAVQPVLTLLLLVAFSPYCTVQMERTSQATLGLAERGSLLRSPILRLCDPDTRPGIGSQFHIPISLPFDLIIPPLRLEGPPALAVPLPVQSPPRGLAELLSL